MSVPSRTADLGRRREPLLSRMMSGLASEIPSQGSALPLSGEVARPTCWYVRLGELALGISTNSLITLGFDYMLCPALIYWLGLIYGGIIVALLSFVTCLLMLWFYDWSKRDWLGIEAIKTLREHRGDSRFRRMIGTLLRMGDIPAVVLLSVWQDAFITMVYFRRGQYNGMTGRDWSVFIASWAVGNSVWLAAYWCGISLLEWLWS